MGKSRNSSYYQDFDETERDLKIQKKDRHKDRKAKQAQRDKRFDSKDDDDNEETFYEDDSYRYK